MHEVFPRVTKQKLKETTSNIRKTLPERNETPTAIKVSNSFDSAYADIADFIEAPIESRCNSEGEVDGVIGIKETV